MKSYPSIPHITRPDENWWFAFDKIDGSLIRAEWNRKQGLYKFGSRTHLIDESEPILGEAVGLVDKIFPRIEGELIRRQCKQAVLFFEFYGDNSFAGSHEEEEHRLVLVDAALEKKGLVDPDVLLHFAHIIPCPRMLGKVQITEDLLSDISSARWPGDPGGITFEGVVFKRMRSGQRVMCKKKTNQWLAKLRQVCGSDGKKFDELR